MSVEEPRWQTAGLAVRLLALLYETLLLAAVLFAATAVFTAVTGVERAGEFRGALQVYLLAVTAGYFVWSWTGGRRTLAMRTWRLRLVDARGHPPRFGAAVLRFVAAAVTLPLGLVSLWWALIDRDRQFLHDRLAGTRLVREPAPRSVAVQPRAPR